MLFEEPNPEYLLPEFFSELPNELSNPLSTNATVFGGELSRVKPSSFDSAFNTHDAWSDQWLSWKALLLSFSSISLLHIESIVESAKSEFDGDKFFLPRPREVKRLLEMPSGVFFTTGMGPVNAELSSSDDTSCSSSFAFDKID